MAAAKPQCSATAKSTRKQCTRPAIPGGTVCRFHGGAAPQVRAKAEQRETEREIREEIARLDVDPVADPLTALAQLAGQVLAWKDALAEKVNELASLRYESYGEHSSGEQLRAEVALWERALDRCNTVLGTMARLNIDERLAKVTERQAEIVANAVVATIADLGLPKETQREARSGVVRRLRSVS